MKRKLMLIVAMIAILACLFALSVSAAEPDTTKKTVTLEDGTVCAIWDTDGNPLHWYVTSNVEGVKTYAYIAANDSAVDYNNGWNGGNQLGTLKITVDGVTYDSKTIAVLNLYGAKITSGHRVGNEIDRVTEKFSGSNLEHVFLPTILTSLGGENFKSCSNLKSVNFDELNNFQSVGAQAFNGCSKLYADQVLDLSNTKLTGSGNGAFCSMNYTEIILPTTFTSVGEWTFQTCKKLTKITFLGEITSLSTNSTFKECEKLVEIVGLDFAKLSNTSFSNYTFYNCYALEKVPGLIENKILTIPDNYTSVGAFTFTNCDKIEAIIFPSTFNFIGQQGFSYMGNVKIVDFGKITGKLTLNNCGHFRGLTSLVAVSLPEGMEEVSNRSFADCTNLQAVYMPNSVKYLSSNGGGQGSFCNSTKLYFVQESFSVSQCIANGVVDTTKLVMPQKPDVYFMPTSLETFTGHRYNNDSSCNATIFKNCTSLNSVLVFPESFKVMTTMRPFEGIGTSSSPKTLVFLGNIESFSISHQNKYVTFVFANENDKSFEDLGVVRTTGNSNEANSYAYFCASNVGYNLAISGRAGSGTDPSTEANQQNIATTIAAIQAEGNKIAAKHVSNPNKAVVTPADCLNARKEIQKCFCGADMGEVEIGTALGHNHVIGEGATVLDIVYENGYFGEGYKVVKCERCDVNDETQTIGALFTGLNYSAKEDSKDSFGLYVEYSVNQVTIKEYEATLNKKVSYGVVAIMQDKVTGAGPLNVDGTVADGVTNVVAANVTSTAINKVTLIISGSRSTWTDNEIKSKSLYILGYASNGTSLEYLGESSGADVGRDSIASVKSLAIETSYTEYVPVSKENE